MLFFIDFLILMTGVIEKDSAEMDYRMLALR